MSGTRTVSYIIKLEVNVDVEVPETDDIEADRAVAYPVVRGIGSTMEALIASRTDGEARVSLIRDEAKIGRYAKYAPKLWTVRA